MATAGTAKGEVSAYLRHALANTQVPYNCRYVSESGRGSRTSNRAGHQRIKMLSKSFGLTNIHRVTLKFLLIQQQYGVEKTVSCIHMLELLYIGST